MNARIWAKLEGRESDASWQSTAIWGPYLLPLHVGEPALLPPSFWIGAEATLSREQEQTSPSNTEVPPVSGERAPAGPSRAKFDALTHALGARRSRRGMFGVLASGIAAVALVDLREDAEGKRKKRSGRKGKNRRKRGSQPAPPPADAFGCTLELNSCGLEESNACPEFGGGKCFVTVDNQPFCGNDAECVACQTDQDCLDTIGRPGFRCVACAEPKCQGDSESTFCLRLEIEL